MRLDFTGRHYFQIACHLTRIDAERALEEAWPNRKIAAKALTAGSEAQFGFGEGFESSPSK
jgi:hypothetical protein